MLICLGGFLGSGRSILAHRLADRSDVHYLDLEQKKFSTITFENNQMQMRVVEPNTDALRMQCYGRAAGEFPMLAKLYPHVVVHDAFHRAKSREYFFSEAKKSFPHVFFIWIDAPDISVTNRLIYMKEKGIIKSIPAAQARRKKTIQDFEPFTTPPLTFRLGSSDRVGLERFQEFLKTNTGLASFPNGR